MIDSLNIEFGNNIRLNDPDLIVVSNQSFFYSDLSVHDSYLWTDSKRGIITGKSAYFMHNDVFPFDITYRNWRDGKMHLVVSTSVPKLLDGVNLREIDLPSFEKYLSVLREMLFKLGIEVNIDSGRIIRIDLFKQDKMISDFDKYAELFNQFNIPRTDLRKANTSYTWINRLSSDWAINVYDKGVQMKSRDKDHNIIRIEVQLRKLHTVQRVLGFNSIGEPYMSR